MGSDVPTVWVCKANNQRAEARGATLRPDGWPICPYCDEDELWSSTMPAKIETIENCYVCGPVYVISAIESRLSEVRRAKG